MKRSIRYILFAICFFAASTSWAATLTVSSLADSGPGTLRDSIAAASPGDTIIFSVTGTITLVTGQLLVNDLTISGPGAGTLAIDGNSMSRIFVTGGTVSISGLTIQNGYAGSLQPVFPNPYHGGGILNLGSLTVTNCIFSSNLGNFGGAIENGNSSSLSVIDSTFANNISTGWGSAFGMEVGGPVTVTNSTFSGNHGGTGNGLGAIYVRFGSGIASPTTITDSTFTGNYGNEGAAITYDSNGPLTITNSTFSGNMGTIGGSLFSGTGGILVQGAAVVTVTNSTFSGNAGTKTGGILDGNRNSQLIIKNTIMSNNIGGNCGYQIYNFTPSPPFTSQGYNLSDDDTCTVSFTQPSDMNNTLAGLDPAGLQDNGGPTQTIALIQGSPAVDAIPVSPVNFCTDVTGNPVTTDQRGTPRPQGSGCDIGAFELVTSPAQMLTNLVTTITAFNLPNGTANSLDTKLSQAESALAANLTTTACNHLNAFINEVSAQSGKKLTTSQANQLIAQANTIMVSIGCH